MLIRAELGRVLLDLTREGAAARLAAVRAAMPRALALVSALTGPGDSQITARPTRRHGTSTAGTAAPQAGSADDSQDAGTDEGGDGRVKTIPVTERRRAAEILVALWADVARDLALVGAGGGQSVHDPVLLEELTAVAITVDPDDVSGFLDRAARGAELLVSNVSPELLLDTLALAWPRPRVAA